MYKRAWGRSMLLLAALVLATASSAFAQAAPSAAGNSSDGWKVTVYPLLAWLPTHISIDLNLPQGGDNGDVDGGDGDTGGVRGEIVDSRFDGAYLGGFSASRGPWRFDGDVLWAAVGGDRPERPELNVDVDLIYGHATAGLRLYKALYATAGVRRVALKYDIRLADLPSFERKPGIWDPLVGLAFHHVGNTLEVHAVLEGGGFGVGADVDVGGSFRVDFKPTRHFGLTGGYSFLHFEVSHELAGRTLIARQSLHGPVVGFGLYF